ncbi:hypothetical protein TSAR_006035 [Trichomalopsis sarcophagae]|uniref:FYVE-type zinc finger domain-containing protein n=1 Tax=Trichomalopsis sarcophagae TaxID=543379 RepID=A0A232FFT2_9HYME|nr:hypothetical protein TSAR_006035 [Trichomalopsis sarcophagae]
MITFASSILTSMLLESDRVVSGQERYNLATLMVIILLVTIEVMVVKVVTAESEREDESPGMRDASLPADNGEEEEETKERKKPRTKSKKLRKKVASILADKSENRCCACCLKPLALGRTVRCCDCGASACRNKCSRLDQRLGWCCLFCYQQRVWLRNNRINVFDRLNSESEIARNLATPETEPVRCGDNASVDAKSAVYTAIRKLVDHAVDEVQRLPSLENSGSGNDAHRDFSRKSQDNLLATVIANEVIAKCQSERTGNGSVLNLKEADNHFFEASETSRVDGQSQSCDRSLDLPRKNLQAVSVASKCTQTQPSELSALMVFNFFCFLLEEAL